MATQTQETQISNPAAETMHATQKPWYKFWDGSRRKGSKDKKKRKLRSLKACDSHKERLTQRGKCVKSCGANKIRSPITHRCRTTKRRSNNKCSKCQRAGHNKTTCSSHSSRSRSVKME